MKKLFDVQSIAIETPVAQAFRFIADPRRLPEWANAFESVEGKHATLSTPAGRVDIDLEVRVSRDHGTVDWYLNFHDGGVGRAISRLVEAAPSLTIYSFTLVPPPAPFEQLEGARRAVTNARRGAAHIEIDSRRIRLMDDPEENDRTVT